MLNTALFITVKEWKQCKHPLSDECINTMWHPPCSGVLLTQEKKQSTLPRYMSYSMDARNDIFLNVQNKTNL